MSLSQMRREKELNQTNDRNKTVKLNGETKTIGLDETEANISAVNQIYTCTTTQKHKEHRCFLLSDNVHPKP